MTGLKKLLLTLALSAICLTTALCFVACGGSNKLKPPAAVDATTIRYDGEAVTWQEAKDATSYEVSFNGVKTTVYSGKFSSGVPSSTNQVDVTVTAKNSAGSAETVGKSFTRLRTINSSDLQFDVNGKMSWEHVEGATGYVVEINGNEKAVGASNIFSDFLYGQQNTIRVKALGSDNTFATYGSSTTKTYLAVPTSLTYDGEMVSWTGSPFATSYTLYIDESEHFRDLKNNRCDFTTKAKKVSISVQSVGDGKDCFSSKRSSELNCIKLDDVSNIRVEEGVLKWDAVEYATAYQVNLDGNRTYTERTELKLSAGQTHTIKIKPVSDQSDVYFSSWGDEKNAFVLVAPQLKWNKGMALDGVEQKALIWDSTNSAGGYKIELTLPNGKVESYDASTNDPSFSYAFLESGYYKVRVKAITAETDHFESAYSEPFNVQRLEAPKLLTKDAISSTSDNFENGFTVRYEKAEGASGYNLYRDNGYVTKTTGSSFNVRDINGENENSGYEYTYSIRSTGTVNGTTARLDSLTSKATSFKITVLATPTDLTFEGGSLTWTDSFNQTGYSVRVDAKSEACSNNAYKLSGLTQGEHEVSVCAKGNGKEILASRYTAVKTAYKLAKPTNVSINTETNEGSLKCDPIDHVKSYTVYFNSSSVGTEVPGLENVNVKTEKLNDKNGLTVVLVAHADYIGDDGVYYVSSDKSQTYSFVKLNAIDKSSVRIVGQKLFWNAPDNIASSEGGKIKYKIYSNSDTLGSFDTTSIDLSSLSGGEYTYTIKCVGDGKKYFNSVDSDPIPFIKLETVELKVNTTKDGYSWHGVAGATEYSFKIGDEVVKRVVHDGMRLYEIKSNEFLSKMNRSGQFDVSVIAVGNANDFIMDSSASVINQKVKRLNEPEISVTYDCEAVDPNGNIVAELKSEIPYANGYNYSFSGTETSSYDGGTTCSFRTGSTMTYSVTVKANGGKFDEEGYFYCDSSSSGAGKITLLDAPTESSIEKTADNRIYWTAISGEKPYTYKLVVEYSDGSNATYEGLKNPSYTDKSGKTITSVKVTAVGNGTETITSKTVKKAFN